MSIPKLFKRLSITFSYCFATFKKQTAFTMKSWSEIFNYEFIADTFDGIRYNK